jgi:hypothetical protein
LRAARLSSERITECAATRNPRANAPAATWIAWWAVFLAKYKAATSRIIRIAADIAGHGVNVNRLGIDMAVLA